MTAVDEYQQAVIRLGDEGSDYLAKRSAESLKNNSFTDVITPGMNGLRVISIPKGMMAVVHSADGDPNESNLYNHSASLVERLVAQAKQVNAVPLAICDVIDASEGKVEHLKQAMDGLLAGCSDFYVSILNGELAILGNRVTVPANVSGTMISMAPRTAFSEVPGVFVRNRTRYFVFDPKGKPVYGNSDGIGTATEFPERTKIYSPHAKNFIAMNVDDAIKNGALVMCLSGVAEMSGNIPFDVIERDASKFGKEAGFTVILQPEDVGNRIASYKEGVPAYNISGSAVSTIDEERLRHPLVSKPGDYLVAFSGYPNPRSNGITSKRKAMVQKFGIDWHEKPECRELLNYLMSPAIVLYPFFRRLVDEGVASSFYHPSGGAYDGKLARPLAKHNLFACLDGLVPPKQDLFFMDALGNTLEQAYAKWPMGVDGFATTCNPDKAIEIGRLFGLEGRVAGRIEEAVNNRTGVELHIKDGPTIYFSGSK